MEATYHLLGLGLLSHHPLACFSPFIGRSITTTAPKLYLGSAAWSSRVFVLPSNLSPTAGFPWQRSRIAELGGVGGVEAEQMLLLMELHPYPKASHGSVDAGIQRVQEFTLP